MGVCRVVRELRRGGVWLIRRRRSTSARISSCVLRPGIALLRMAVVPCEWPGEACDQAAAEGCWFPG